MMFRNVTFSALFLAIAILGGAYVIDNPYAVTVIGYLLSNAEAVVAFFLLLLAIGQYTVTAERTQFLQQRENYLRLEFESVALFRFCSEHPDVPNYLEGKGISDNEKIDESVFWFVCQSLNLFEIIVTFRKDEMVSREIFSTWIAWFYELGTAERFKKYWDELSFHYVGDVAAILDKAIGRAPLDHLLAVNDLGPLREFYEDVSDVMQDSRLRRHCDESVRRLRVRLSRHGPPPSA